MYVLYLLACGKYSAHSVEPVTMAVFSPELIAQVSAGLWQVFNAHNVYLLVTMAEFSPKAHSASVCNVYIALWHLFSTQR